MSGGSSKWDAVLRKHFETVYDSCLELDAEDLRLRTKNVTGPFVFHCEAFQLFSTFLLGQHIKEFSRVCSEDREKLVLASVYRTFRAGTKDFGAFEQAAREVARDWSNRPNRKYRTWIHLDISALPDELAQITLNGVPLQVVPAQHLLGELDRSVIDDLANRKDLDLEDLDWLVYAEHFAPSQKEALSMAASNFEVLRGLCNLLHEAGRASVSFGGTKETCTHYPPVAYAIADDDSAPLVYGGYASTKQAKSKIPPTLIPFITQASRVFAPKYEDGSVRKVLAEAIQRANEGLDSIYPGHQFLGLWTALETMALVDRGSPMDVAKRIPKLWLNGPDYDIAQALHRLAYLRNDLVHEGRFDHDSDDALLWLRQIVALAVLRTAEIAKKLPRANSLRELYCSHGVAPRALRERVKGIQFHLDLITSERTAGTKEDESHR